MDDLVEKIKSLQSSTLHRFKPPSKQHLYAIYHLIINQFKFKYSLKNVVVSLLTCIACRKTKSL